MFLLEADTEPWTKSLVSTLAGDLRGLSQSVCFLRFQGVPARIIRDPAVQGCHEAWLHGIQSLHQFWAQFGCPYPTKNDVEWGETRCRMARSSCVKPTGPVTVGGKAGKIRKNATLQYHYPLLVETPGDIPTSILCPMPCPQAMTGDGRGR